MRLSFALRGSGTNFPATQQGAIAQLAERLDRTQEVGGSNPPSSIDFSLQGTSFRLIPQCFVVRLNSESQP
jgi:hypothetical protein